MGRTSEVRPTFVSGRTTIPQYSLLTQFCCYTAWSYRRTLGALLGHVRVPRKEVGPSTWHHEMTQVTRMHRYRILVEGTFDPSWSDCLGGLVMSVRERPSQPIVTELSGQLQDQSALQGVLDTLFMLNMRVLLVERDSANN